MRPTRTRKHHCEDDDSGSGYSRLVKAPGIALGIDIGGSGVKGAVVNLDDGSLLTDRLRLKTPKRSTPEALSERVARLVDDFDWEGPVGVGFPGIVQGGGLILSAANLSDEWVGCDARSQFERATGLSCEITNDADAAGIAEMRFGAGREFGARDTVLFLTLGTGIGSALFVGGKLVPNTEFGHLELYGKVAERHASDAVREREKISWKKWASRLDQFLERVHLYLSPDVIVLGGGVSRQHQKFIPLLEVGCPVIPARLRNLAGIIGAALAVDDK